MHTNLFLGRKTSLQESSPERSEGGEGKGGSSLKQHPIPTQNVRSQNPFSGNHTLRPSGRHLLIMASMREYPRGIPLNTPRTVSGMSIASFSDDYLESFLPSNRLKFRLECPVTFHFRFPSSSLESHFDW